MERILRSSAAIGPVGLFEDILARGFMLRVRVTGKSMTPFLKGQEVLSIRKVPGLSLRKGDLIFFKNRDGRPVIHRIVRKRRNGNAGIIFQTKGDALAAPDEPVREEHILGKVCTVENGPDRVDLETGIRRAVNYLVAAASLSKVWLHIALRRLLGPVRG